MRKGKGNESVVERRTRRKLALARWVLTWEAALPLLWPIPAIILLFLALALFDVLPLLPGWLHAGALLLLGGALSWRFWRFRRIVRPGLADMRRRVEEDSGLANQPLSALADRQSLGADDPVSRALWQAERRRLKTATGRLSVGFPRPVLAKSDPLGLRFVPLAMALVALTGGWHDVGGRLSRALTPSVGDWSGPAPVVELWITPPAYTRIAPIFLDAGTSGRSLSVPEGSSLLVELQGGGGKAELAMGGSTRDFATLGPDSQRVETVIRDGSRVLVRQGLRNIASWTVAVVRDQPPAIVLAAPPGADEEGRLRLAIEAHDDYGIARVWATVHRVDEPSTPPLEFDLPLEGGHPASVRQTSRHDLTGHPWAGLPVSITLGAEDDAGHRTYSEPVSFILPQRYFSNPFARAIVAQRQKLIANPALRDEVAADLMVLTYDHNAYGGDFVVCLALSVASDRLTQDRSSEALSSVIDLLWQTALRVEEGDRPAARQTLDDAMDELRQALARGASGRELERLTEQLRQAMNRYLQSLAEQAQRQGIEPRPPLPGERVVTPGDLKRMMEELRDLSRTGSEEEARRKLAELGALLDGLETSVHSPGSSEAARAAANSLNELNEIAKGEQKLLDETFRKNREEPPHSGMDSPFPGLFDSPLPRSGGTAMHRRGSGADAGEAAAASRQQEALRQRLGKLMEGLDAMGLDVPDSLGRAGDAMGGAAKALGEGALDDAVDAENEAVESLREGTQAARKALAGRMGGGVVTGNGEGGGSGTDPLGRQGSGTADDPSVAIPGHGGLKKAREVLDELRRRAADTERPPAERDYLNRLLKNFF